MGQHWVAQAFGLCSPTNVTAPRRLWQRWKSTVGDVQFRLLYQIYRPWLVDILQNVYWLNDRSIDQSINRWINQSINQHVETTTYTDTLCAVKHVETAIHLQPICTTAAKYTSGERNCTKGETQQFDLPLCTILWWNVVVPTSVPYVCPLRPSISYLPCPCEKRLRVMVLDQIDSVANSLASSPWFTFIFLDPYQTLKRPSSTAASLGPRAEQLDHLIWILRSDKALPWIPPKQIQLWI